MLTAFDMSGTQIQISRKRHSFSVGIGGSCIYYFDLNGRLMGAFIDGTNYVRGLSGKMLRKRAQYTDSVKTRLREEMSEQEKRAFLRDAYEAVTDVAQALIQLSNVSSEDQIALANLFERVQSPHDLQRDAETFHRIYKPISILPPDQYLSVVLQVTEGCSHNKCTFCNFYHDRRFRIKSDGEIVQHIADIKAFLGESISLRRSIFLADANAIVIPQARLRRILDQVQESFTQLPPNQLDPSNWRAEHPDFFDGIYSFMDMFDGRRKSSQDFAELAQKGLRRVYIGLETGCDDLLRYLRKAGNAQDAVSTVLALKEAGIQVGVIIMLGVGGDRFAKAHVQDTIQVLNAMRLSQGDIVYTSLFVEHQAMTYTTQAREEGIRPLTLSEMLEQRQLILDGLELDESAKPRISNYDIREFVY